MSLFSTPSIRVFNAENAESTIQRKPGVTNLTRLPFMDKTVNINKSPDVQFKKHLQAGIESCANIRSPSKSPSLDLRIEDLFSFKDKEMFDDELEFIPGTKRITKEIIITIVKNFHGIGMDTPPLSPTKNEEFIMPSYINHNVSFELETPDMSFDCSFGEVEPVEMPSLDFSDFEE